MKKPLMLIKKAANTIEETNIFAAKVASASDKKKSYPMGVGQVESQVNDFLENKEEKK